MVSFLTKPMKLVTNVLVISVLLFVVSCGTRKSTGWQMYSVEDPLKALPKKIRKELTANFELIKGGTFVSGRVIGEDGFLAEKENKNEYILIPAEFRVTVSDTYIQKTEVSVADFLQFYDETKDTANKPDTACFINDFSYAQNEPIGLYYFTHAKYRNYPVCGVNLKQAESYCKWKTEQFNTKLKEQGSNIRVAFRLPTAFELEKAMIDECSKTEDYSPIAEIVERLKHSNTKGLVDENNIQIINPLADGYAYTAPVATFKAENGLYNLYGNVAEWTQTPVQMARVELGEYESIQYKEFGFNVFDWRIDTSQLVTMRQKCAEYEKEVPSKYLMQLKGYTYTKKIIENLTDTSMYIAKGGSYAHSSFYMQAGAFIPVKANQSHSWLGFRMVLELRYNLPQY